MVTNTSKSERVFVVEVIPEAEDGFAEVSISRDENETGTALSKEQEEEAEGMLQKLKIARRKGKEDKIAKLEARLTELGVKFTPDHPAGAESDAESDKGKEEKEGADAGEASDSSAQDVPQTPSSCVSTLNITLFASQKTKISVQLLRRNSLGYTMGSLKAKINVYEKKNTDETVTVGISASMGNENEEKASVESGILVDELDSTTTSGE